ncbi:MAG TPA: hypothetical protein VIU82_22005 [Bosea sp. (in: a-proteobacteria)]
MAEITVTITRDGEDIDLEIEYEVADLVPGRTYGLPEDCYPAEGGEVEDLAATLDGKPFEMTDAERAKVETRIYETHDYSEMADVD